MKKSVLVIMMTVMLAIVVAACGSNNNKEANTATNQTETATNTTNAAAPEVAAESKEITIKHQLGETVVTTNPEKVVVFDFGILDSLDKLAVEVTGVPQANIPPYLSKYEDTKYTNVGSLKEPDFEAINALSPDLIIISGRQQDAYEELNKIAPTIFLGVDNTRLVDSFKENMNTLGQVFNKQAEIDEELVNVDAAIKEIQDKATASGKNSLIVLANEGKLSAYGPGSRFGIIHDVLGFTPVDENIESSTHGQTITSEFIAEKNPDYLFVVDRGSVVVEGAESASAKDTVENELVQNTKAFKEGHIVYLDPNYWYLSGGGLVSMVEMINSIGAAIQ
ncbi:siderophore ABC transporter substrate-binding protein [Paenibacillus crassostreae]|uniref:ABC transporter n=1 Tax=Paenibacillus crassostreae TaxID=1763538 RepID=A0A167B7G0_9BACL|nr:siderophore ABC transporter substrate-binding protein [Paenibacillus crassostreae]AOZ93107.1 ABC transporter [Paenibacillus crassostreae]OAB71804.1 ABC transporter [Paenibacillus crassostreae]